MLIGNLLGGGLKVSESFTLFAPKALSKHLCNIFPIVTHSLSTVKFPIFALGTPVAFMDAGY